MLSECAGRIADILSNNGIIKSEDKEIYVYGLDTILSTLINLAMVCILGVLLGLFVETLVFLLAFAVLRVYTGGYHAKTHINCITTFISIYLTGMAIQYFTPDNLVKALTIVISLFSTAIIFMWAPIEHKNRPFEGDEYKRFRKISRIVVSLETIVILVGIIVIPASYHLLYCIALAMINVVLILALAKIIEVRGE